MGFRGNRKGNKNKNRKSDRGESRYLKVASVWPSKDYEGQVYIECDDYFGELLFREKKTGKLYKVDYMNLFEPKSFKTKQGKKITPPEDLLFNVCVNPANPSALTKVKLADLEDGVDSDADEDSDDDDADEYRNSPSKRSRKDVDEDDADEEEDTDSDDDSDDEDE